MDYCHIDEFLADNYAMWQKLLGAHCRLSMAIDPERSLVEMDTGQIAQLISNLLLNAEEADAQNITLRTGCRTITTADVHFWQYTAEPLAEGRYVIITVADDGKGMDSHTREKLFDPFFTTKFTGRGLGMAASLGIVRGHRGGIAVRSQRNGGSTFEIAFPLVNSDRNK